MRDERDVLVGGAAIIALRMSEGHSVWREREKYRERDERKKIKRERERERDRERETSMAVIWAKLCAKLSSLFKRYASLFTYHINVISDCN